MLYQSKTERRLNSSSRHFFQALYRSQIEGRPHIPKKILLPSLLSISNRSEATSPRRLIFQFYQSLQLEGGDDFNQSTPLGLHFQCMLGKEVAVTLELYQLTRQVDPLPSSTLEPPTKGLSHTRIQSSKEYTPYRSTFHTGTIPHRDHPTHGHTPQRSTLHTRECSTLEPSHTRTHSSKEYSPHRRMFQIGTIPHRDTLLKGVKNKSRLVPQQLLQWLSISLPKEENLQHPKPFTEVCKLHSGQRLGKDICNLLIRGDKLEVNMFGPVMEHRVL